MSKATYRQPGRPSDDFDGEEYEEYEEYEEAAPEQVGPVEAEAYDDTYDEEYDEVYDEEEPYEQPGGIFATPARTITLVASVVVLLVVFGSMAWLIGQRGNSGGDPTSVGNVVPINSGGSGKVSAKVGALAPDFELTDVTTGEPLKLSSLKGKPVFVNFWGTWCPPCRAEMPEMQRLYDELNDQVEFVGVSMGPRDSAQGVEQFVKLENYTWKFVHDPDLATMQNYRVTGIPSSYFIDKDGIIRAIHVGGADYTLLERNLQKALNTQ